MLERGEELVEYDALDDLQDAWVFIEAEGLFDDALTRILAPEMDQQLRAVGLVDAPRELKTNGSSRAYQALLRKVGSWSWPDVKPVLRWANVILGSPFENNDLDRSAERVQGNLGGRGRRSVRVTGGCSVAVIPAVIARCRSAHLRRAKRIEADRSAA